jgi:uncharacterized phage protein (TIGR01671 family)
MNDRFKFNALVSSWYDIDTPEDYQEFEPTFYLKNVDVFCTGEIGIDYDTLLDAVKEQSKNLTEKEIGQIMQHFEDNSNSPDCDFVTITPDKILQCTGLKDKNGKLIYEGDILKGKKDMLCSPHSSRMVDRVGVVEIPQDMFVARCRDVKNNCTLFCQFDWVKVEVIGNIYENKELLEDTDER